MKNLVLICAGGFGREIAAWAPNCIGYNKDWKIKGFIDSDLKRLDNLKSQYNIIDTIKNYQPKDDDVFLCAIGDVTLKKKFVKTISSRGGKFINLIHNSVIFSSVNINIGTGCFLGPGTIISNDVTIHDHVTLNCRIHVSHDVVVSKFSHANPFSFIGGYVFIGENVIIHPNSTIVPNIRIGDNSIIGSGSVVLKNVKQGITVFGIPAKKIY